MFTLGYFRVLGSMTIGNLGKAIILMVKMKHKYLSFILYLVTSLRYLI